MIKIYDGVFTDQQCKKLIDKFQNNEEQHEIFNNDVMQFTQYNFTAHHSQSKLHSQLSEQVAQLARRYFPDVFVRVLPNIGGLEQFRIKKYNPGGEFKLHIDVMNRESSIRAVGFLFYLNDSDGYTDFINHNISIKYSSNRVGDMRRNYTSIAKIKKHLNWSPKISIEEGLESTIKNFIENYSLENLRI